MDARVFKEHETYLKFIMIPFETAASVNEKMRSMSLNFFSTRSCSSASSVHAFCTSGRFAHSTKENVLRTVDCGPKLKECQQAHIHLDGLRVAPTLEASLF